MSDVEVLRQAIMRMRMYSCDAYVAMEAMAEQLEDAERVIERLRGKHPQAVAQAELDVRYARATANAVQTEEKVV